MKLFSTKNNPWIILAAICNFLTAVQIDAVEEKCYEAIGCFSCNYPFFDVLYRPVCTLPQDNFSVRYLLFTRPKSNESFYLESTNATIAASPFDRSLPTKILIPGFNTTLEMTPEFYRIKDELLEKHSYNVIIIDWTTFNNYPYTLAVANGRVVAGYSALLLKNIKEIKGIDYKSVHIIGHSLGAHIAGWIGERLNKLGRITGLDPAGPYFQQAPDVVRLDKSDADFVDIIHTNGGKNVIQGFGLNQAIGHVDFYPNGGKLQPACGKSTIVNVIGTRQCAHSMSINYFRVSINKCRFTAVHCKNYRRFANGQCNCNNSITDEMGFHAKKIQGKENDSLSFYLHTAVSPPYCYDIAKCGVLENQNRKRGFVLFIVETFVSLFTSSIQSISNTLLKFGYSIYSFIKNLF